MPNFTSDADYIYIGAEYAEAYVPESLFAKADQNVSESAVAYEYGNGFMVVGVFDMRFFKSDSDDRESVPLRTFCYPNVIETYPTSNSIAQLTIRGITDKYRVFKYYRGDILMNSAIKQSVRNCEQFMNLITSGKIPRSLAYPDIFHTWIKNFEINGIGPEVPSIVLQTILSEMCRDMTDPSKQFRKTVGKGGIDLHAYRAFNMNQVSAYSSTMSALSFERISEKLTTSLLMTKKNVDQPISPIEKVLTM